MPQWTGGSYPTAPRCSSKMLMTEEKTAVPAALLVTAAAAAAAAAAASDAVAVGSLPGQTCTTNPVGVVGKRLRPLSHASAAWIQVGDG